MPRFPNTLLVFVLVVGFFSIVRAPALATDLPQKIKISQASDHTIHMLGAAVIAEAYKRLGIRTEFIQVPSKRSLTLANLGRADAEVGRVPSVLSDYKNLMMVDGAPIATVKGVALTISSDCVCKSWDDLKEYRVGIRRGEVFAEKGTAQMNAVATSSYKQLFTMLENKRIDVAVGILTSAEIELLSNFKNSDIKVIGKEFINLPLYHMLNNKYAALAPKLTEVLLEMHQNGDIEKIHSKTIKDIVSNNKSGQ